MVKVLFEERNARFQGESSNPPKGYEDSGDKNTKGNGGNGDTPPPSPHLHLPLLLPFHNHFQILQKNMVKFLHNLIFLSLILSLNCLCTMER
jgi:hypothetical protein